MASTRIATADDLGRLWAMGNRFHEAAGQSVPADEECFRYMCIHLMSSGFLYVLESSGNLIGMLGGMAYPHWWNRDYLVAQELFWWCEPEARGEGGKLLSAFEDWARNKGVSEITMVGTGKLKHAALSRYYERRGYKATEQSFTKGFENG